MENEKLKIKIEIDFTYDTTALKTLENVVKEHNEVEKDNLSLEKFLDRAIENLMYDRFECDYECIDGEEYKINWTIEKN